MSGGKRQFQDVLLTKVNVIINLQNVTICAEKIKVGVILQHINLINSLNRLIIEKSTKNVRLEKEEQLSKFLIFHLH